MAQTEETENGELVLEGAGAPTAYRPEYATQAAKLCELGATDSQLADFFKVSTRTIYRWINQFPKFCHAIKTSKSLGDQRVERSLYHRAMGYSFDAVKIFMPAGAAEPVYAPYVEHVPPDTAAMIFWLKNRQPDKWRDVQKHEHGKPGDFDSLSDEELDARILELQGQTHRDTASRKRKGPKSEPESLH